MKKFILQILIGTMMLMLTSSCSKDADENPIEESPKFTGPNTSAKDLTVRVLYLVPSDKKLNEDYTKAAENCILNLISWYKTNLGSNKTFQVNNNFIVETIQSDKTTAWFDAKNGYDGDPKFYFFYNTENEVKRILGAKYDDMKFTYLVYVDAQGGTGAGRKGFTAMPENDLLGLTGQMQEPVSRWIGGAGHELGHAFGLEHPATEDKNALMWTGYTLYPNCIFMPADKAILNANPFLK